MIEQHPISIYEICFSPTGGTKKAADILSQELSQKIRFVDLTDSSEDFSKLSLEENDVAVIAVPSYGGRVPKPAVKRISHIQGNGAKVILVCVYGNRAYEDTLVELLDTVKQADFRVVSAVATIAEHSIAHQFASGRPDSQDRMQLRQFAKKIQKKLKKKDFSEPQIPGNRPYKKSGKVGMVPKPTRDCVKCGLCAEKCPIQAIDKLNPKKVEQNSCISCMRCVSVCPHSARKVNGIMLAAANTMLKKVCSQRKDGELYL